MTPEGITPSPPKGATGAKRVSGEVKTWSVPDLLRIEEGEDISGFLGDSAQGRAD